MTENTKSDDRDLREKWVHEDNLTEQHEIVLKALGPKYRQLYTSGPT